MKEYGISQSEAIAKLNSGGYKVYTTVDLNMQNFVEENICTRKTSQLFK